MECTNCLNCLTIIALFLKLCNHVGMNAFTHANPVDNKSNCVDYSKSKYLSNKIDQNNILEADDPNRWSDNDNKRLNEDIDAKTFIKSKIGSKQSKDSNERSYVHENS